jgi:hypothetical protein
MSKISMSTKVGVPADKVWELIGGFNDLADWHPAIAKSELEEEDGATIRTLHLVGGGVVRERLEMADDEGRAYTYSIIESPLPVADYSATIQVSGEGDDCTIEWSSNFNPQGAPENDAVKAIQGIYQAGFDNLQKIFGGR